MASTRRVLTALGLISLLVPVWAVQVGAAPITTFGTPAHFRWHIGPNSVGLAPGDQQFVGILNVLPTAGTVVTATQGAVTRPLPFQPFTVFPTIFRSLDPFDPALSGSWSISATNGPDTAGPILTSPILSPQLLPFVEDLQILGSGASPTVTWTLPDLTGFDVDLIRFRVLDDVTDDLLLNVSIAASATSFTIPGGVLVEGVPYIFQISVEDQEFGNTENVSATFTQSPFFVPEPASAALLGAGLAGFAASGSRRRPTP